MIGQDDASSNRITFVKRAYLTAPRVTRHDRRQEANYWRWRPDAPFDPYQSDDHEALPRSEEAEP